MSIARVLHILGVICAYLAGIGLIVAGALNLGARGGQPAGVLITWGVAFVLGASVALLDGARAMPQLGIWRVGARFSGLSDLAVIILIVIVGAAFGISMAF
jgi:hypothetical protein